jgi:hypothetical protein
MNVEAPQPLNEFKLKLMEFPAEIRNIIYRYTLVEDHTIQIRAQKRDFPGNMYLCVDEEHTHPWREPGILQVSKVVRTEVIKMYHESNGFEINIWLSEMDMAVSWIRATAKICGN